MSCNKNVTINKNVQLTVEVETTKFKTVQLNLLQVVGGGGGAGGFYYIPLGKSVYIPENSIGFFSTDLVIDGSLLVDGRAYEVE